jgi:hypothetical protein
MTLGRQKFAWMGPSQLSGAFRDAGLELTPAEAEADMAAEQGGAEPVFRRLGAREVRSLDASTYEGATDVHDLNDPLPDQLKEQFTCVLDGGTLEHVFNLPRGIQNAMEMVAPGGHLLLVTPTNNADGHGFYQFSPELYFRVLSPVNGFVVERMLIKDVDAKHWFEVVDPAAIGRRVEFRSPTQAYLYVQARRIDHCAPIFREWPQQSDYRIAWESEPRVATGENRPNTVSARTLKAYIRKLIPPGLKRLHLRHRRWQQLRGKKRPLLYRRQPLAFRVPNRPEK